MLIMRMFALYERSGRVLALYIIVAVVITAMGWVSLNLSGNQPLASNYMWHIVGGTGWKKRKKNGCTVTNWLQSKTESTKIGTSLGSKFI